MNSLLIFLALEEQTKIANFLSAIDQKIEVIEQQIEQAKQWKKVCCSKCLYRGKQ